MDKVYWNARDALAVWSPARANVADMLGGERVFQDHAHHSVAKSGFCEGVWWAWRLCRQAQCATPVDGQDAADIFEFYDNRGMAAAIVAAFEPNAAKREALIGVRRKSFIFGVRQARPLLVVLWAYEDDLDPETLTHHDRDTWARRV